MSPDVGEEEDAEPEDDPANSASEDEDNNTHTERKLSFIHSHGGATGLRTSYTARWTESGSGCDNAH